MSEQITSAIDAALATAAASDAAALEVANSAEAAVNSAINASDTTHSVGSASSAVSPAGSTNTLINNIIQYQYNPAGIQSAMLQTLSDVSNGTINIVDPTNPFVFCLEAAAVCTAAFMMKNEANTRKQYPFNAQSQEDLYLHMSDIDYINRFAVPTTTTFALLLPLNEVLNKMVLNSATGIKQLVIPRNTMFTVAGINFSIQYPIMIQQMQHGGLQILYDTSITSPLQELTSNFIKYEIRQNVDEEFIYFEFDVTQFDIISETSSLNAIAEFTTTINFTDQYYYTRAYVENANGTWSEIRTTHTDELYDINVPTAVLKVFNDSTNTVGTTNTTLGGRVEISIPQIYTGTGVLRRGVRFDVYQTKGPLSMILWEYPFTAFSAKWLAIDINDRTKYVSPLNTFNTIVPFSTSVVTGGKNATDFASLRDQVITNAIGAPSLPITNAQIKTALDVNGYSIVTDVDNITNRIFLATKAMPTPEDVSLITPAGANIATINTTIDKLVQINSVIDNSSQSLGSSITITPDTIYHNVNGITNPLSNSEITALLSMNKSDIASAVSNGKYLYTPFHYILDMTKDSFDLRAYYLDSPAVLAQLFGKTNDSTLLQVNTGTYSIYRSKTGYTLTVVTLSSDGYKAINGTDLQAQLSFTPDGQSTPAYLTGTLMGTTNDGECIFSFDLSTNFNVDANDKIQLSTFMMFADQSILTGSDLVNYFDIVYSTTTPMTGVWVESSIDKMLSDFLLPSNAVAITHEKLKIKFGDSLTRLWTNSRSVVSTEVYKKWTYDTIRTYSENIYATDVNGSVVQFDEIGNPVLEILHNKGDFVLDADNAPIYLHRTGDIIYDNATGKPIVENARGLIRQIDLMLIEGAYWFASDVPAVNYRSLITQSVLDWVTNDLGGIESQLLEQTNIYFYPTTTLGSLNAKVDDGVLLSIDASQSFTVDLYVSNVVYNDTELRKQLTTATIKTISEQLKQSTFSIDSINTALRSVFGNDVVSMKISGIGGSANYSVVTILDSSKHCSIKKKLVSTADGSLIVTEDVTVGFVLYQV